MAKEHSDKSKYQSPSTGEWITPSQYVAELLCKRQAEKKNVGALAYKYWNFPPWDKIFIRQVTAVSKLIKEFGEDPVVKFFLAKENEWINSTGFKGVKTGIAALKIKLESQPKVEVATIEVSDPTEKPRPSFNKKTPFSRLKNDRSDISES